MNQTLQYKSYLGAVEYSADDHLLHGALLGIRDAVVYEGKDVDSLESNFRAAVDEYLAFCEAEGKTPDRPFKGSFNVRVNPELHKRLALYAEERNEKLNNVVSQALEAFIARADQMTAPWKAIKGLSDEEGEINLAQISGLADIAEWRRSVADLTSGSNEELSMVPAIPAVFGAVASVIQNADALRKLNDSLQQQLKQAQIGITSRLREKSLG